jgi:alpha-tubulin suppressor-like RCC1 family protein
MMSRREAMKLLAASPFAAEQAAARQSPAARGRRIIAAGADTFLIEPDGSVKAWSLMDPYGWRFGLGNSERVKKYTAYDVPLKNVVTIAAGVNAAYAVLSNGTVMAWGGNFRGELGATPRSEVEITAGGRATAQSPIPVLDITDAIDIDAGDYHALAVTRGGQLWVWGYNLYEQLGIEMPIINYKERTPAAMQYLPFPMRVAGLTGVVAAAGGGGHSLALLKDGTVRSWGANKMGQLGDGTTVNRTTPVRVPSVQNAVAIAADADFSAALLADGTVMTWGHSSGPHGRLGLTDDTPCPTPTLVPGATNIRAISIGGEHMVGLTRAGTVLSWGHQRYGEVGHPGITAAPMQGLANVASVEAYVSRTFAVLENGTIMVIGAVPYWARFAGDKGVSTFPIPLLIKNLKNPM